MVMVQVTITNAVAVARNLMASAIDDATEAKATAARNIQEA